MERARYREYVEHFGSRLTGDGKSRNTVASYTRDVGEFLGFLAEHELPRIDQITEEQVAGFVAALASRELGERSKAKKLTSIRSFLVWARAEGHVESYPRKLTFARIKQVIATSATRRAAAAG